MCADLYNNRLKVQEYNGSRTMLTTGVGDKKLRTYHHSKPDHIGTIHSNFVSFYFTNVPDDITYSSSRQGFEVCGIMEDVYLARKRNVNGAVFGFVCYAKVKDVDKLLRVVNNVWFGDCKMVAKVSCNTPFSQHKNFVN